MIIVGAVSYSNLSERDLGVIGERPHHQVIVFVVSRCSVTTVPEDCEILGPEVIHRLEGRGRREGGEGGEGGREGRTENDHTCLQQHRNTQ